MAVSVLVRLLETHGVRRRVRSIREKSWRRRSRSGPHWRIALRKLVALRKFAALPLLGAA